MHFLLIEHDALLECSIQFGLETQGNTVSPLTGAAGLSDIEERLLSGGYQGMIVDIDTLPFSLISLMKRIQERQLPVSTLVIYGFGSRNAIISCSGYPSCFFLEKPVRFSSLKAIVAHMNRIENIPLTHPVKGAV